MLVYLLFMLRRLKNSDKTADHKNKENFDDKFQIRAWSHEHI